MPPALQTTTRDSSFASTRWTVVRQAADSQTASQHALSALSELCQIYWRPVYVFLRRQGIAQHDAQDLTQGFFADLIESRAYARADPIKGRFRSFLLGTLKHFVAHARDRDRAQKRGGANCKSLSLGSYTPDLSAGAQIGIIRSLARHGAMSH